MCYPPYDSACCYQYPKVTVLLTVYVAFSIPEATNEDQQQSRLVAESRLVLMQFGINQMSLQVESRGRPSSCSLVFFVAVHLEL